MATGMTRKASLSNMRSWSEPRRPPQDHVHAAHPGAGGDLEHARPLLANARLGLPHGKLRYCSSAVSTGASI